MTELKCPEDGEPMYSLKYQKRVKKIPSYIPVEWYWCEKCQKPVQVKVTISSRGFK